MNAVISFIVGLITVYSEPFYLDFYRAAYRLNGFA
jgi:hypothetical protein